MDAIIGRTSEKKILEHVYQSNDAEFVAIYGRRRVGKTYLIRNFFQSKKSIFFQVTGIYKGLAKIQLEQFGKEIGNVFYQGASIQSPTKWMDALEELSKAMQSLLKNKKIVLFFDELPWMATDKSGMISALEYFWNRHWVNDGRIKLIVCGSSASWIIKKLIKSKGGLHNRLTQKIRLMPFDLSETYQYLKFMKYECNYKQTLKIYMSMGGVPFYLKRLNKNNSIDQNIDHLFFNPDGVFFDEFDEVFSSLFDSSDQYKEIVELISAHKDGVPRSVLDVENKLTGSGGRLTKRLEDLETAGFITSYLPFARRKIGIYYRINDEYCYFYLKWIAPIKSRLKQDKTKEFWKRILNTTEYHSWQGYVFENICFKHTSQIKKTLCISETALSSPWRYVPKKGSQENGAQIDLLFDRDDNAITLCEIKHTEQPFSIDKDYAEKLKQKISVFKDKTATKKQVFLSFISTSGLKKNTYFDSLVNGVVRLEDLFL